MNLDEKTRKEREAFLSEHLYFLASWAEELPDGWKDLGYELELLLMETGLSYKSKEEVQEALTLIKQQQVAHRRYKREAEINARRDRFRVITGTEKCQS